MKGVSHACIYYGFFFAAVTGSVAFAGEVKECWFSEHGHDGTHCKVVLVENERGPHDEALSTISRPGCEKVKLFVDCDCDFKLRDEYATQFEKHGDEFNVGSEDGKLAVLVIKNEDMVASKSQKAVLTISKKDDHDSFARRLVGECRKKD